MTILDFLQNQIPRFYWCLKKRFPIRMLLCDVNFKVIPASTRFGHPYGITIRDGVKLGKNCEIHQNVTIGQRRLESECAVIGDNVSIGAGAIILGPIVIGNNSQIAAGSIVLTDVPENSIYISKFTFEVKQNGPFC